MLKTIKKNQKDEISRTGKKQILKKKSACFLLLACLLAVSGMPVQEAAAKKQNHAAEYARFGITVQGNAYYYNGTRIRIFQDMRPDYSFENSFADCKGTADVRLLRGINGEAVSLELIPKDEAREILEDLTDRYPSGPEEKPQKQNRKKKKTAGNKMQEQKGENRNTKKNDKKAEKKGEYTDIRRCNLNDIPDCDNRTESCVLLSLGRGFDFTLSYQGKQADFHILNTY